MNDNSAHQTTTFSHQNYGENFYVPPPIHQNPYDISSNSTMDSDALRAQQGDQAEMAQPSMPQKKIYEVYYHQPGEEFAAPSQSKSDAQYTDGWVPTFSKKDGFNVPPSQKKEVQVQVQIQENATTTSHSSGEYVPIFPKTEGGKYPFQSGQPSQADKYVPYSCQNCGKCYDCKRKIDEQAKKTEDACMCCMKWTMLIAFGICIGMAGGEHSADCSTNDCCDEPKKEHPRNQNPFRL